LIDAKGSWLEPEGHETEGGAATDKAERKDMATMAEWKRYFMLMGIPPAIIADEATAILAFLETKRKREPGSGLPDCKPLISSSGFPGASSP
jgi:hypothetical protein